MFNEEKINEDLRNFWNLAYEKLEPMKIDPAEVKVESKLDEYLKEVADKCPKVLDFGTGSGRFIITAAMLSHGIKEGIGIDTSANGINFANGTSKLSGLDNLNFIVGDHLSLRNYKENYFDGIICSNTLDVVPLKTSNEMIKELTRVIKPKGYFVLKINFYLNDALIKKINMEEVDKDTYTINGIMRGLNHTDKQWIDKFNEFELIKSDEFERIPNGPKDRVFMFRKK